MARIKRIRSSSGDRFIDTGTSNLSFLQLASDLKELGVSNYYFMLEIYDISLVHVNPHAVDEKGNCSLTKDEVLRVLAECRRNVWYYLREVCRIPDQGNPLGIPYKANRGNIAQAWCILHGIDSWLCLPRQQGKTQSALAMQAWIYSFGTTNSTFIFINKDSDNAKENLNRLKDQIDLLPAYMKFESFEDDDGKIIKAGKNATTMKHPVTLNKIIIKSKATSYETALSLARGLTAPLLHFDEPEFTNEIKPIVENSVSTYATAAKNSKANHCMYARIFTCTPGDLDTKTGIQSQQILDKTVKWSETLYDMTREQMEEFAAAGNSNHIVYIEFMYFQIGLDRAWLENISAQIQNPLVVRREILLQRLHGSSLSPYPKEDIEYITDAVCRPIDTIYLLDYYRFDIYAEINPNVPYILGIDCSTGTGSDNNAITALNPYTLKPVMEFECSYVGETIYEKLITEIVTQVMPRAIVCIERNSVGDGIIDHLLQTKIANRLYYDKDRDLVENNMKELQTTQSMLKHMAQMKRYYGVYTGTESRKDMFTILSRHVAEYKDNFVTQNITRDLSRLVRTSSGKIEAGSGFHDDSVMSYLIALYVFYHGNNLELFGFIPGSQEIQNKNQGIARPSDEKLAELLPSNVVSSIKHEEEVQKLMDYESLFREAMVKSQVETSRLMNSSLGFDKGDTQLIPTVDGDEGEIDLGFFDSLNGL